MKFGITNKVFYDEYLSEHICSSCKQNFSTKLVIYCRVFATGFAWWAWGKQGYLECNNCGTITDIRNAQVNSRGLRSAYSLKSIPVYNFLPAILIGALLALGILGTASAVIQDIATNNKDKFQGLWEDESGDYALFAFNDNEYTFVSKDTIIFSKYNFDTKADRISIPIKGAENLISNITEGATLRLNTSSWEDGYFLKTAPQLTGDNPYRPKHNLWRMKATHEESNTEIRKRILGYLQFMKLRYEWALRIRMNHLPADVYSPVIQARNGIGIYKESLKAWRPVFFSDQNWETANKFLKRTFPDNHQFNYKEQNIFIRNMECIDFYIENAEKATIE